MVGRAGSSACPRAGEEKDREHHRHGHPPPAAQESATPGHGRRPSSQSGQPETVEDHDQAGQSHGQRGDQWVEEAERGQWEGGDVVAHRPSEVLDDHPIGGSGHPHRSRHAAKVVSEEGDVAVVERRLRPTPDGAPDVGCGERRRIIDSVADHQYAARVLSHTGQRVDLAARTEPGAGIGDAQ
jgi:hypothetical protein